MTERDVTPQRQRVIDYIAGFGLDAHEIARDSIGDDGFKLRRPGADPDRMYAWPEDFNYDWLCKLLQLADESERAQYTRKNHVVD